MQNFYVIINLSCRFITSLLLFSGNGIPAQAQTPEPAPSNVAGAETSAQLDNERLALIEPIVRAGIEAKKMPGCVVCVGTSNEIVYLEAFGQRNLSPESEPMTVDTVFDMASITKPVATATCVMKLVEDGHMRLGDRVVKYFPEFAPNGKNEITIHDLLVHQSGLIPDNALADYMEGPDVAWQKICKLGLVCPVGEQFKYSDVNYIVLAKLIEKLTGKGLHEYSQEEMFIPLGMTETGFNPGAELKQRAAVTEKRNGHWMRGEVHDPRAYRMDGVAGHAGLFSTARDLAVYARMMLGQGTLENAGSQEDTNLSVRILSPQTFDVMTRSYVSGTSTRNSNGKSNLRGLGWDIRTGYSSNRGDLLSDTAFGHGGFTGTVVWIDPELDLFFIFLSNRVHPDGSGAINHLAGQIANVVASSVVSRSPDAKAVVSVLPGIDVLKRENFRSLKDQRVGLITNQTGCDINGTSTISILHQATSVNLVALFSPEHGLEGILDTPGIDDADDGETGLHVFSLYGETREPTAEMLSEIDTLVFDIQDIGTRFYTYISTMGLAMKAAAEHDVRFVVLDRPNPLGGIVSGPMRDNEARSFVAFHNLAVRHGMTVGELAGLMKAELNLDVQLEVIRCEGWTRDMTWDLTGLTWVNPSPNMRSLTQAFNYPGIGLLEMTNVSVGRGTDTPFEVLGAPWINARQFAEQLNNCDLPGVVFVPVTFTPRSSTHSGEKCNGINVIATNWKKFEPVRTGIQIAAMLRRHYPNQWQIDDLKILLRSEQVFQSISNEEPFDLTSKKLESGVPDFMRRRNAHLLYR